MRTTFRALTGFTFAAVGFLLWLVPSGLLRLVFDNVTWVVMWDDREIFSSGCC